MTSLLYICLNTLLHIYHHAISRFFNNWNIMPYGLSTYCIITYVFLFLARLRFPAQDSIIKILRRRYGDGLVKKVRKFEKFDFKYRKALLDLEFLQSCKKEKLILKFLQFKVANKRLESSKAYLSCQRRLLNQEMSIIYKSIRALNNEITSMKNNLYNEMRFIDYVHVIIKLLVSNDENIYKICKNQGKKLHNFFTE